MVIKNPLRHANKQCPRYKWVALSNTTLGILMAALNHLPPAAAARLTSKQFFPIDAVG